MDYDDIERFIHNMNGWQDIMFYVTEFRLPFSFYALTPSGICRILSRKIDVL